jgi:hypothetical protein
LQNKKHRAGLEADSRHALKAQGKFELNNMTKKRAFFGLQNATKMQARKNGSPQFKIPVAAVASEISFYLK